MRELKEEMATLSRQEEEHKKRKMDAVSIICLAFQLSRAGDPNRNSPSSKFSELILSTLTSP